jgi:hypothetical protein
MTPAKAAEVRLLVGAEDEIAGAQRGLGVPCWEPFTRSGASCSAEICSDRCQQLSTICVRECDLLDGNFAISMIQVNNFRF